LLQTLEVIDVIPAALKNFDIIIVLKLQNANWTFSVFLVHHVLVKMTVHFNEMHQRVFLGFSPEFFFFLKLVP
jgi:hypothetical protein